MPIICICIKIYIHLYQQKSKIMYTTKEDPSDGYSNHWSNGQENDDCCPTCGREANLMHDHYLCKSCNETFNYFDENGELIND